MTTRLNAIVVSLFFLAVRAWAQIQAQPSTETASESVVSGGFSVAARDAHSRVWERPVAILNQHGGVRYETNRYNELATGLHFWSQGQWKETVPKIEMLPNGNGASATNGPHQLYLPSDIYSGAVEIVGPDGAGQQIRPMGLVYFDGNNSLLIAQLTNSIGQVLPTGNQVLYPHAFTGANCDLLVTYRRRGIECDLIFRGNLISPSELGLDPARTQIQLLSESLGTNAATQTGLSIEETTGVADADLAFGVMKMKRGVAFEVGTGADGTTGQVSSGLEKPVSVSRSWEVIENRNFIVESVPYQLLQPKLARLASNSSRLQLLSDQPDCFSRK